MDRVHHEHGLSLPTRVSFLCFLECYFPTCVSLRELAPGFPVSALQWASGFILVPDTGSQEGFSFTRKAVFQAEKESGTEIFPCLASSLNYLNST